MELTQMKPGLPVGFHKTLGNIGVPLLGGISLYIVALQCWRAADGFQCFLLTPIGLGIGVIGLSYYRHRRALSRLEGKIDDSVLSSLYQTGNSMAFFGFLVCEMALIFSVHRH